MKILVLNYEYPPLGGGAGVITKNISERLALFGHSVTVVTTWFKTEKETEQNNNLKIIRLKSKRKVVYKSSVFEMLSWIKVARKFLIDYCEQEKFDLCFANFSIPGGMVAAYLKRKFGLKFTIISHGHDIPWRFPKQMFFFHLATYFKIKRICRSSEAIYAQTAEMKKNLDHFSGEKSASKNILIPNGIDSRLFKPDFSQRNKTFKIIFSGRLVMQKDPFSFLEAIKQFAAKNKNFIVQIIGDGILRKDMENFVAQNELADVVKFTGWISAKEIAKEYQSAHVHVVSSLFEGMSIAVLESLASGCFLITTPLDGIKDVITENETATLVGFHSPSEILHAIEQYYKNNFLTNKQIPEQTINDLRTQYDWDVIVRAYEKSFSQIVT
jgi:glycosyltransferase involved in cell wall biosynthesis